MKRERGRETHWQRKGFGGRDLKREKEKERGKKEGMSKASSCGTWAYKWWGEGRGNENIQGEMKTHHHNQGTTREVYSHLHVKQVFCSIVRCWTFNRVFYTHHLLNSNQNSKKQRPDMLKYTSEYNFWMGGKTHICTWLPLREKKQACLFFVIWWDMFMSQEALNNTSSVRCIIR